jgi:hypothetical protein
VSKYLVESYIVNMMKQMQEAIWPDGALRKTPPSRTAKEKAKTKRDAGFKLAAVFEGNAQGPADNRFRWEYHGPRKRSLRSSTIGSIMPEYSFEYPFCIHYFRRTGRDVIP